MDRFIDEEIKDVLKGINEISGSLEKLVRGRWTDRWVIINTKTTSFHYFLSKNDRTKSKIRGIYSLIGATVETEEENGYYSFTIHLVGHRKVRFRTKDKNKTHTWSMIIRHLATQDPGKGGDQIDGILTVKSGISWSKRLATLDPDLKILSLGKTVRNSEDSKPEENFNLEGGSVHPVKSYGKTFEFELSAFNSSNKCVNLRLRAPTEEERFMWCKAIQQAIENKDAFQLSPTKGNDEGTISVLEVKERKPGSETEENIVVVLKGLQDFSSKIAWRISYYLQPHSVIHMGNVSKVYKTSLKTVTGALLNAGFTPGVQDTTPELIFEFKPQPSIDLQEKTDIDIIIDAMGPMLSSP